MISIHAPREGSDQQSRVDPGQNDVISIHAPREGSDRLPDWRECFRHDFNPRSPRGERPFPPRSGPPDSPQFQSTLPARGATGRFCF